MLKDKTNHNIYKMSVSQKVTNETISIIDKKNKKIKFKIIPNKNLSNSIMNTFLKFSLIENSKCPTTEWCGAENTHRKKHWSKNKQPSKFGGIGIPCGKVNNIFVVDLDDYKWAEDHPFIQKFGKGNYDKIFNTYIQQSCGGAWHLFFKYDEEFSNKCHAKTGIDILSDRNQEGEYKGKYVVGAGTTVRFTEKQKEKYNTEKNWGTYKSLNNKEITECPEELKEWLRTNIYSDSNVIREKQKRQNNAIAVSNTPEYFKYNLSKDKVHLICEKLHKCQPKYFTDYRNNEDWSWLIFTTAMKAIGEYKLWDFYSKKFGGQKYNKNENDKIWEGITEYNKFNCFNKILSEIDERTLLDYTKYKPILDKSIVINKEGSWDKLGKHLTLPSCDVQIKSGTGTGKTTITKDYLHSKKLPFLSIVSRKSLGYEQYKTFIEHGIDCIYYENYDGQPIPPNKNVIIQIDSIMKIHSYLSSVENYTIFLDEYSSLIEHLITSPTLNKTRALVFKIFKKVITLAKQVISVDADLTDHTLEFLKFCGRDLNVWNNTFNHYQGVEAVEYYDIEEIIKELKLKEKFMLCMDSKNSALAIFEKHFNKIQLEHTSEKMVIINGVEVNKYSMTVGQDEKGLICCITADNDYCPDLDKWDRVIFSPKIIYGLDSTMEREVFCIYKEHTISPKAMIQQISRCRNMLKLNYLFCQKKFTQPLFINYNEVAEQNDKRCEYVDWLEIYEEGCSFYKNILAIIDYNDDCYSTNKFVHFKNMLIQKGFIDKQRVYQTKVSGLQTLVKDYTQSLIDNFDEKKPSYIAINKMLKIPEDQMADYAELFINENAFTQYKNVRNYIMNTEEVIESKLNIKEEFNVKKIKSSEYKVVLIQKFLKHIGANDKFNIKSTVQMEKLEGQKWFEAIHSAFRLRLKNEPNFSNKEEVDKVVIKCIKQIFGTKLNDVELTQTIKTTKDKKTIRTININYEYFQEYEKLLQFQDPNFKLTDFRNFEIIDTDNFISDDE